MMSPEDQQPSRREDREWDELVENFRALDASPAAEPSAEDRQEELRRLFSTGPGATRGAAAQPGPRDYSVQDAPEEFVPEEPAALGSGNPMLNLAWIAAAGAPVGLLICVIFFRSAPALIYIALVVVAVLGALYLLRRLPEQRDPGDDGARV